MEVCAEPAPQVVVHVESNDVVWGNATYVADLNPQKRNIVNKCTYELNLNLLEPFENQLSTLDKRRLTDMPETFDHDGNPVSHHMVCRVTAHTAY